MIPTPLPEYKIPVMGFGKSSIVVQFTQGIFVEKYDPTIEDSYKLQREVDGIQCQLEILDTAGTEQFTAMRDLYVKNGDGFIIVFSIIAQSTFNDVPDLIEQILRVKDRDQVPLVIVGNNCSLSESRVILTEQGESLAKKYGAVYIEACARTRTNIDEIFFQVVREVNKSRANKPKTKESSSGFKKFFKFTEKKTEVLPHIAKATTAPIKESVSPTVKAEPVTPDVSYEKLLQDRVTYEKEIEKLSFQLQAKELLFYNLSKDMEKSKEKIKELTQTVNTLQQQLEESTSAANESKTLASQQSIEISSLQQQIKFFSDSSKGSKSYHSYFIDHPQLEIDKSKLLGKGSFGKVYYGKYFKSPVAIKKFKEVSQSQEFKEDFENEIKILLYIMSLKHPNVVTCLAVSANSLEPLILMEFMSNGSLYGKIQDKNFPIEISFIFKVLKEIALGMHYLHSKKPMIIHRDLKSLNVLLDSNMTAKISDFGLSKTREYSHTTTNTAANTIGSVPWAAPEYLTVKRIKERNEKGDIYSFGVIAWELVTRQTPWKSYNYSTEDIKECVVGGVQLEIPSNCTSELAEIMKQCWDIDPQKRASFSMLVDTLDKLAPETDGKTEIQKNENLNSEQIELQRIKQELMLKKKQLKIDS